jgi:hypothetical protein
MTPLTASQRSGLSSLMPWHTPRCPFAALFTRTVVLNPACLPCPHQERGEYEPEVARPTASSRRTTRSRHALDNDNGP